MSFSTYLKLFDFSEKLFFVFYFSLLAPLPEIPPKKKSYGHSSAASTTRAQNIRKPIEKDIVELPKRTVKSTQPAPPPPPPKDVYIPTYYIESYYYGLFETGTENDSAMAVHFEAYCPECNEMFRSNNDLMDHLKRHAVTTNQTETSVQCRYCLTNVVNGKLLDEHLNENHPLKSKYLQNYFCLICSVSVFISFTEGFRSLYFHNYSAEFGSKCI